MSRACPAAGCRDLPFHAAYAVDDASEVALEDYARTVGRASAAETVRGEGGAGPISGVHLCGTGAALTEALAADIEDFARDLAVGTAAGGLGWS